MALERGASNATRHAICCLLVFDRSPVVQIRHEESLQVTRVRHVDRELSASKYGEHERRYDSTQSITPCELNRRIDAVRPGKSRATCTYIHRTLRDIGTLSSVIDSMAVDAAAPTD